MSVKCIGKWTWWKLQVWASSLHHTLAPVCILTTTNVVDGGLFPRCLIHVCYVWLMFVGVYYTYVYVIQGFSAACLSHAVYFSNTYIYIYTKCLQTREELHVALVLWGIISKIREAAHSTIIIAFEEARKLAIVCVFFLFLSLKQKRNNTVKEREF